MMSGLFDDAEVLWDAKCQPLIKLYEKKPHPLNYKNLYQLIVMVILSAQDSDKHINQIAPAFFEAFPDFASKKPESLHPFLNTVRNFGNKCK